MWLLDANVPRRLAGVLRQLAGIEVETAQSRGWGHLKNGALVEAAAAAGFVCILTRDRLFSEAAARSLKRLTTFSVVLIRIPQSRWTEFESEFKRAWSANPIAPIPGRLTSWPSTARGEWR